LKIAKNRVEYETAILSFSASGNSQKIGFVPTMGALHQGHLSLITAAKQECDVVICSIFVNPTQFNNPKDLATYPRNIAADLALLEDSACDIVFLPTVETVYPDGIETPYSIELGPLAEVMEGEFRPGHFAGVCMVVERFFNLLEPNLAFFGEKDFQQLAVIKRMVEIRGFNIGIRGVPIMRNSFGLALSSRNELLSEIDKKNAEIIFAALSAGVNKFEHTKKSKEIEAAVLAVFNKGLLSLEYFSIVDGLTLQSVEEVDINSRMCVVAYCGGVRLIDNMGFSQPF
jgi:pantoate--beta-alanine ligase